ncbi:MAG: MarR family transcriptional regulator [Chrysiogenales bacterium]|nr:MAG: MarR family transcriptional regulator [Chrysiogenales bacterium]
MNTTYNKQLFTTIRKLITALRIFQNETIFCGDVTFTQFSILNYVSKTGVLEMSTLHELLSVEKSTTTRLVEPLITKGCLEKRKSLHDSRVIELHITTEGKKVHHEVWSCINDFLAGMNNSIPTDKKNDVLQALDIFTDSIESCCKPSSCCQGKDALIKL